MCLRALINENYKLLASRRLLAAVAEVTAIDGGQAAEEWWWRGRRWYDGSRLGRNRGGDVISSKTSQCRGANDLFSPHPLSSLLLYYSRYGFFFLFIIILVFFFSLLPGRAIK